jgi:addiction module HigA family antidote
MPNQPPNSQARNWAVHPGEILDEWMTERHVRVDQLATATGLHSSVVMKIRDCQAPITPDIAERLEGRTHIEAAFWLALQSTYDNHHRRQAP